MDIFELVKIAKAKVEEPELFFNEEVQTLVAFLRSKGVLAVNRTEQHGHLHYLFCATLVSAYYIDKSIAEGNVHLEDAIISYIEGVKNISKKVEQVEQLDLTA